MREVETPRAKLLILFYSLMSQSGLTIFCQNSMLLLYDLSLFVQIQQNPVLWNKMHIGINVISLLSFTSSKLTIETEKGVFLVFLLYPLNICHIFFYCFYC